MALLFNKDPYLLPYVYQSLAVGVLTVSLLSTVVSCKLKLCHLLSFPAPDGIMGHCFSLLLDVPGWLPVLRPPRFLTNSLPYPICLLFSEEISTTL